MRRGIIGSVVLACVGAGFVAPAVAEEPARMSMRIDHWFSCVPSDGGFDPVGVTMTDADRKPLSGIEVTWTASTRQGGLLGSWSSTTGRDGRAPIPAGPKLDQKVHFTMKAIDPAGRYAPSGPSQATQYRRFVDLGTAELVLSDAKRSLTETLDVASVRGIGLGAGCRSGGMVDRDGNVGTEGIDVLVERGDADAGTWDVLPSRPTDASGHVALVSRIHDRAETTDLRFTYALPFGEPVQVVQRDVTWSPVRPVLCTNVEALISIYPGASRKRTITGCFGTAGPDTGQSRSVFTGETRTARLEYLPWHSSKPVVLGRFTSKVGTGGGVRFTSTRPVVGLGTYSFVYEPKSPIEVGALRQRTLTGSEGGVWIHGWPTKTRKVGRNTPLTPKVRFEDAGQVKMNYYKLGEMRPNGTVRWFAVRSKRGGGTVAVKIPSGARGVKQYVLRVGQRGSNGKYRASYVGPWTVERS